MIIIDKFDIDILDTSILCYYNTNIMFALWTDPSTFNDGCVLHLWNYWSNDILEMPVVKYTDNDGISNICKIIGTDEV
jgi:hypothetical protein